MRRTMKPSPRSCTRASAISVGVVSMRLSSPGPLILRRSVDLRTQLLRRAARKVRVAQAFACDQHDIGITRGDDLRRLFGAGDQADRAGGNAGFAADARRERNLIAGRQ